MSDTVEQLETEHATLKQGIALLVDQASRGENDGADIVGLTKQAAALTTRIAEAKAEREQAEREQARLEREEARTELTTVLREAVEQRDAFLTHYRASHVALGNFVALETRAGRLANCLMTYFGMAPQDANAIRALQLGNRPQEVLSDLVPDMDTGWKLSFTVTAMRERFGDHGVTANLPNGTS